MVNNEEESNLLNEDVKCFLIEEFGHNIKFSESEKKNESQFVFSAATKVEAVINSLLITNAAKNAAEVIQESLLEVYNLVDSFCDAQDFKQSWRQTTVPGVLMLDLKNCSFVVTRPTQLWVCPLKIFYWTSKSKLKKKKVTRVKKLKKI